MTAVTAESEPAPESAPASDPRSEDERTPFRDWPAAGRWVVYTVIGLVIALIAASIGTAAVIRRSFPRTDGTVALARIDGAADIRRDARGVPHVEADTAHDLFLAQGYAQAQDRFFAMDVARHRAAGRLSELLGRSAVSGDLTARTLGWRRLAETEYPDLAADTRAYLQAFSAGVNAYLRTRTPSTLSLEYTVLEVAGLDYKPEPWTPADSLAILKAEGSSWRDDVATEVDRARLAVDRTPTQIDELYPKHAPAAGEADAFVVSGALSASGRPLLADALSARPGLPSAWSQVSLQCRPVTDDCPFDVTGGTLDGVPGVLAGHNDDVAWGLARSRTDVADMYLEEVDGKQYLRGRQWRPLLLRDEKIRIQGAPSKTFTVRATEDGPLLSDVSAEVSSVGANAPVPDGAPERGNGYAVALAATALAPALTADALFELDRAEDARAVRAAAAKLALPGHDLLYAAEDDRIGKVTLGPLPTRSPGRRGLDAAPGWRLRGHWLDRTAALPVVTDPVGGVIGGNARIRFLVTHEPTGWTADELGNVQTDTLDPFARVLVRALQRVLVPSGYYADGRRLLADWDHRQSEDSAAAAYYAVVWSNLLRLTFHDQLRSSLWPDGSPRWATVMTRLLGEPNDPWWDDVETDDVIEDRDTILAEALRDARNELTRTMAREPSEWSLGRLLRLHLRDAPLRPRDLGMLSRLVDRGPYGVGGGNGTATGIEIDLADDYDVVRAPALRFVVDLGDLDASRWVVLGGTSGHAFAGHYRDQTERWRSGGSYLWPFTDAAVRRSGEDVLRLRRSD